MFGLHPVDLIVVLVVALLIFGPKKLPEMGSSIGKSIKEFRKGMNEIAQPKDDDEKPNTTQRSSDAARLELEAIERELASKKAALAAQESQQFEVHTENVENMQAEVNANRVD
ncbi:MAG TPA: twin-arginine translocase TatA/TatE family subunit [Dictyobacter sp.]|jgi:sec-independent protein translocase protein TatA|nr:twin-arginine translocase TatA/TatE family subunit [Dictyobacter sp.]